MFDHSGNSKLQMQDTFSESGKILITGGTSGLGLELVRFFLDKGYFVVATGRQLADKPGSEERFRLYKCDFSNLRETAGVVKQICDIYDFDYVVYNAGILSPPGFTVTNDGFEYTFQVNFLAHLLANEIITRKHDPSAPLVIAAVTSMVYRIASHDLKFIQDRTDYRPLKAYSDSKLYMALMCRHLAVSNKTRNISFFSFDPGIFGSRIYRMQSGIFKVLYTIGALFMRKPASIARELAEIMTGSGFISGETCDRKRRLRKFPEIEPSVSESFWKETMHRISQYLD